MEDKLSLGKMLTNAKLITEEQLKMAIDFQQSVGGKLGAIIVKLGFIEDSALTKFIAKQQGMTVVDLDELVLPENLVKRVPKKMIEKHHVIPIRFHDGILTIATSDPFDYEAVEELQLVVDSRIEMQLASRTQILRAIRNLFDPDSDYRGVEEKTKEQLLKDLEAGEANKMSPAKLQAALIPLLIDKGVISESELNQKARKLDGGRI